MASEKVRENVRGYRRTAHRKVQITLLFILVIFALCVISLSISRVDISLSLIHI